MTHLTIYLHEGFEDDVVLICLDGSEVKRLESVTTRLLTGHAETVELEVAAPKPLLTISLPKRGLESSPCELPTRTNLFLGASVVDSEIVLNQYNGPLGYM